MKNYLSSVSIHKDKARLVSQYCRLHNITVKNYIEQLIDRDLGNFKKRIHEFMKL